MMTFAQFAKHLGAAGPRLAPAVERGLAQYGEVVKTTARGFIGHERTAWAALAPSTIAEKTKLGYVGHISATDPLLRTGELRDSIEAEVGPLNVTVGSALDKALWQEMGTVRPTGSIPPRPFLASAMNDTLPVAEKIFGEVMVRTLTPRGAR